MRPGKLKASVMKRSVLRQLHKGLKSSGACLMTIHTVEGRTLAPRRAVWGAAGKLLAEGGIPDSMALSILLPESEEEKGLKELIREISEECACLDMELASCTVSVSPHVKDPVLTLSCCSGHEDQTRWNSGDAGLGKDIGRGQETFSSMDLVVAGPVALEGTSLLAMEQRDKLLTRYPAFFVDEAAKLYRPQVYTVLKEWRTCGDFEECSFPHLQCTFLGEGGIFAGLWDYAAAAGTGLEADLSQIPIKQHTIEVCEFFDRNPYQLFSGGSLLMACQNGGRLVRALESQGLEAAVIGHTRDGNDRIIRYGGGEVRYLEPPKVDEYYLL